MNKDHIDSMLLQKDIWKVEKRNTVTFVHADNLAFLRWCKEEMLMGYFHVGIVDPPYAINVGKMNLGSTKKELESIKESFEVGEWDSAVPTQEYWDLLKYACRNIIAWGGNYFTKEFSWSGRCFVVWDKMHGYKTFAHAELALTTFDANAVIIPYSRGRLEKQDGDRRHRTQKPVYLYDYLHLTFVERGQRVLDTHGGSFSHALAAQKNGVNLTIMDKQESYFNRGIQAYDSDIIAPRILF